MNARIFSQAKKLIDHPKHPPYHARTHGRRRWRSAFGYGRAAGKNGQTCYLRRKKRRTAEFKFFTRRGKIIDDIEHENFDLLITFGCSELNRTGSLKIENLTHSIKLRATNLKLLTLTTIPTTPALAM